MKTIKSILCINKLTAFVLSTGLIVLCLITTVQATEKLEPVDGQKYWGIGQHLHGTYGTQMVGPVLNKLKIDAQKAPYHFSDYIEIGWGINWYINGFEANRAALGYEDANLLLALRLHGADNINKLINTNHYNAILQSYGAKIKNLDYNVFIRPFYEINSGSHEADFINYAKKYGGTRDQAIVKAFRKVWNQMQIGAGANGNNITDQLPNCAFVFHFMPFTKTNADAMYPGSKYVDWIGISLFSSGYFTNGWANNLVHYAKKWGKPISICESSAEAGKHSQGIHTPNVNNLFFKKYFDFIENNDEVKMFTYINLDYTQIQYDDTQGWGPWPNLMLQSNPCAYDYFLYRLKKLHTFSPFNNHHSWNPSGLHKTYGNFDFEFADWDNDGIKDLMVIKKYYTGTNTTEVFCFSGKSKFKTMILATGTSLHKTNANWDFDFKDWNNDGKLDLFAVKKTATGTNSTEVFVLSGANNFKTWLLATGTAFHKTNANYSFHFEYWNNDNILDMMVVKKVGNVKNTVEVYALNGATNFSSWMLAAKTDIPSVNSNYDFDFYNYDNGSKPDLAMFKMNNTSTVRVELTMLTGESHFKTSLGTTTGTAAWNGSSSSHKAFLSDYYGKPAMFVVKKSGTNSNKTDVHILTTKAPVKPSCSNKKSTIPRLEQEQEDVKELEVSAFPNPFNGEVNVLSESEEMKGIQVFSLDGKMIYENSDLNQNMETIDAADWTSGAYIVKILFEDSVKAVKVIKQ